MAQFSFGLDGVGRGESDDDDRDDGDGRATSTMLTKCVTVEAMRRIRLRGRALLVFISCFFLTGVLILTSNNQRPTIHNLVTQLASFDPMLVPEFFCVKFRRRSSLL